MQVVTPVVAIDGLGGLPFLLILDNPDNLDRQRVVKDVFDDVRISLPPGGGATVPVASDAPSSKTTSAEPEASEGRDTCWRFAAWPEGEG